MAEIDSEEIEQKKRILNAQFDEKKLQERIIRLEKENQLLESNRKDLEGIWNQFKNAQDQEILQLKIEREKCRDDKTRMELELDLQNKRFSDLKQQFNKKKEDRMVQHQTDKEEIYNKIQDLQKDKDNLEKFKSEQPTLEKEKSELEMLIRKEQQEQKSELELKEKEKVEATDKLKKDMLHKIQETKTSLLALKKEQLQTTIRLTVLQNHQLTTELEYQSKQTEKLLFNNQKLSEEIVCLKRDVEIHKQVEQELAKRSHFCQKLQKKLKLRIQELQDEEKSLLEAINEQSLKQEQDQDVKQRDDIIEKMSQHQQTIEKQLDKLLNESNNLRETNKNLIKKLEAYEFKFTNLAILVGECRDQYRDLIEENSEDQNQEKQSLDSQKQNKQEEENPSKAKLIADINQIRKKPVVQWTQIEKASILQILLNQIIPMIQTRNLTGQLLSQNPVNIDLVEEDEQQQVEELQLPKISENKSSSQSVRADQPKTKRRFQDVPLDISTKIVRSNLREWGEKAETLPLSNNKSLMRRFKLQQN